MSYEYDKDFIKENLTIEQVKELLAEFGGDPEIHNGIIISRTICHGGDRRKLYYYSNTHLFRCFTDCGETFDLFELIRKIKSRELNIDYQLPQAVSFVAEYFGFLPKENNFEENQTLLKEDLTYFQNFDRIKNVSKEKKVVELKPYDDKFLKNFPRPDINPWIEDNISKDIMDYYEICYDPKNCGIVIPHRDISGQLIGIRERTLSEENAKMYGKYMPMRLNGKMYNHPLSFNLYGIYQNKENIKRLKKAFVFEAEKSVLQYGTMFGQENNIAVAICGSSFIQYQAWLLINLGVKEIVVGLDKQYKEINDEEHKKLTRNLTNIHHKYGQYVTISYLFDKENLLSYKASPTDEGKDKFLKLYQNRVNLY